jgi:mediator of RNA polymerase II transcription subunit 27
VSSLSPPIGVFNLGNSSFVNQEVAPERIPLYSQLIDSYKWTDKVRSYAELACPILSQNSLKRTFFNASISAKQRRTLANSHVATPEFVNKTIINVSNLYNDMDITITRPLGSNAALSITLGHTLKAVVILKGWLIEWVVVRASNEDMTKEDGTLDLWTESRYKVFQKVTDNANAAMLHFCAPNYPELSVRSFMIWLHSYITLFSQSCKKCSLHLCTNMMPPTWRDLRSLEPYHEECKP